MYSKLMSGAGSDPEGYWSEQSKRVAWFSEPTQAQTINSDGLAQWFADGELNTCYLCLDYHVDQGRGDLDAIVYDSPVTGVKKRYTYHELLQEVALFAGALAGLGVGQGDRVIIYLPMIPEAVIAMLACARIGAIHSVVFGGFAAKELATRIDDAAPKVILTASCGIEFQQVIPYLPLVNEACELASHQVDHRVILQRRELQAALHDKDLDWQAITAAATRVSSVALKATDPLYILYTSGTTGKPKGVVRDNGGHAVALLHSMAVIYGVTPGDVFWAASDVGWVVGHSYIVYAPLLAGCTSILFEGKPVRTPDAGTFWRVIGEYGVNVFFTAPTAFRAIRKEDPQGAMLSAYDMSSLRALFVAGERTDPATYQWLRRLLQIPVIDHWWQTETGSPVSAIPLGVEALAVKEGSAGVMMPGFEVAILNDEHEACGPGEEGDVVLKLPLPPGCLPTVWRNHQRLIDAYLVQHPGYYHTGDGGFLDEQGYLYIMGRTDDVINVAGHRLSTGEMEEIVAAHASVAECAVVGIADNNKGQIPLGLLVLKDDNRISSQVLQAALIQAVRENIGAFANFRRAIVVERLPKTRSGKILRQIIRKIANDEDFEHPATIDDPVILEEISDRFKAEKIGLVGEI